VSKNYGALDLSTAGRQLPQPTVESIDLSTVLSALADPVRLDIMRALYALGRPIDCAEIAQKLPVSASTVSHHWRVLREAGLTSTVAEGRKRVIQVRHDDLDRRFPGLLKAVLSPPAP
jgi:DNA-binding transcriptional ArsR family regulator